MAAEEPNPPGPSCSVEPLPHRRRPCAECPWRRDVAPGQFSQERFDYLAETTGRPGNEAGLNTPMFACHKSPEGREEACAGWLAAAGYQHLGVRVAVAFGRIDADVLEPGPDWPPLHESYTEMVDAKARKLTASDHPADPRFAAILAPHALNNPKDGACLDTAPAVTEALRQNGFQARTVTIAGWIDPSARIIGFLHQATISDHIVLDGTARQLNPTLPAAWIAAIPQYLNDLADATGVHHAAVLQDTPP